jgi:hypothetical protein
MNSHKRDLICPRCAHADLLSRIVATCEQAVSSMDLREALKPLIAEARKCGFGVSEEK